jgi:ABC-type xylose transport system substrate-binding protein
VQFANDKVQDQQQIESMLNNGAKALIIASVDGTAKLRKASLEALLAALRNRLTADGTPLAIMIEDAQ